MGHAKELQEAAEAARAAESGAWAAVEGADVPLPPRER